MSKEKIVILGSGVAAMTSAVYLTEQADWQDKYDITVYQLGWRLGGKGASGRNARFGERIEEHGLHVWFGAYVNSFRTIETVYQSLGRPAEMPLSSWQQAFHPHNYVVLEELIDGQWQSWPVDFPEIAGDPADGTLDLHFWQLAQLLMAWLKKFVGDLGEHAEKHEKSRHLVTTKARDRSLLGYLKSELESVVDTSARDVKAFFDDIVSNAEHIRSNTSLLADKLTQFVDLKARRKAHDEKKDTLVVWYLVRKLRRWLNSQLVDLLERDADLRRAYICADLAIAVMTGLIRDKVHARGFGTLNRYDFRHWLARNGANPRYSVNSAPVRGFYDLVFAYPDGDFDKPDVEAGVAVLAMLRIALCYRGGVMWKMQAGMGDVIFAPIYELLKKRGVKFEFFHQVDELLPSTDESEGLQVEEIRMTRQVQLVSADTEYRPLVYVNGLPCWPSEPDYAQIVPAQADLLQSHEVNLESWWSNWASLYQSRFDTSLPTLSLKAGTDFDKVIFGISVGSLSHLCPKLLERDAAFKGQAEKIATVATQACQLWLNDSDQELGWQYFDRDGEGPILSGFSEPFDTWASMGYLTDKEQWPAGAGPRNIAYFCSAFSVASYPPQTQCDFPAICKAQVKSNVKAKLTGQLHALWPDAACQGGFNWQVLYDPLHQHAEQRLNSQYWRVNVDPSERYVLSLSGTSRYRLATDGTLFENLFITGDWIKTGVNAGCVEAAVMAGMSTARAICGYPQHISGEHGFAPDREQSD